MRVDARGHGKEAGIAGADEAGATVVVGDVLEQPIDGVPGVSAFVDGIGGMMIDHGATHDELTFTLVASADVFVDEDVTGAGELGPLAKERGARGGVRAIGCALDKKWKGLGDVGGLEDDGVEFDAIAHGDHDFRALVVVEEVMDGIASALQDCPGLIGDLNAGSMAGGVECELPGRPGTGGGELGGGDLSEWGRYEPLGLGDELAVLNVEADGGIRLAGVSVFAGEGVKLRNRGRRLLRCCGED